MYRHPEMDLFPFYRNSGIGNVVFSPLAHGVLTGKYTPGQEAPAGTRAADPKQNSVVKNMYWTDELLEKALEFKRLAGELGVSGAQLALAWVLRRSEVSSAIMGATKVSQVEDNAAAADVAIPDDLLATLDEMFPGPGVNYPL